MRYLSPTLSLGVFIEVPIPIPSVPGLFIIMDFSVTLFAKLGFSIGLKVCQQTKSYQKILES